MARITEVKEVPMGSLVIGKSQARTRDVGKEIDELADSIRVHGLLEPIVIAPAEKEGKYEIITGQRRFLAHSQLRKKTIMAAVLDKRVDETTAKVLSLTENLLRRDLNIRDLIDACTSLYKTYGSVSQVAQETGLPQAKVRQYIKYDRLIPELRSLVDKQQVKLAVALRAQDAASVTGKTNPKEAVQLAREMEGMSGEQRKKLVKEREEEPTKSVEDAIEEAKTGGKITQIVVTLGSAAHASLQAFAKDQDMTQDEAAAALIEQGLTSEGFMEE